MTAAMLSLVGVMVAGGLGRLALVSGRRCEVRWRLHATRDSESLGLEGLVTVAVARWRERPSARRRRLVAELPAALDEIARALRSGASLRQALGSAGAGGPVGQVRTGGVAAAELRSLVEQVERGLALAPVLEQWAVEQPLPEVRLVASALGVVADAGGNAALAVESVAVTLRERHAATEEVRVQSVQARLSATVIALLPLGFTLWCVTTDPRAASFLLGTAAGWLCLASGFALLGVGAWWMARIIRSVGGSP